MASGKGVKAGRAFVEIGISDKLTSGLKRMGRQLSGFGASIQGVGLKLAAIGGAATAALGATVKIFASAGDAIDKMAARTGVSATTLSQLGFAAEQSGASLESLEKGFFGLSRALFDASRGSAEAVDALAEIGLSIKDLAGLSPEQQFNRVADGLSKIADASKRGAVAQKLFGRAGRQLLPMMAEGAAGMAKLREQADSLGLTIDAKLARAAAVLTDKFNVVRQTLRAAAIQIGGALAPAVTALADRVVAITAKTNTWIKGNADLILTVSKLAVGTLALGGTLVAVGGGIRLLSFSVVGLTTAYTTLTGATVALATAHRVLAAVVIANPFAATFTVLAVAVAFFAAKVAVATSAARALTKEFRGLVEAGDKLRRMDSTNAQRLAELAKASKLSANEMAEAKDIIDKLSNKYGDLGFSIDSVAGKVLSAVSAFEKLADAMKSAALGQLDQEMGEIRKNIRKLDEEIMGKADNVFGVPPRWIETIVKKRDEQFNSLDVLSKRRAALRRGDRGALTGDTPILGGPGAGAPGDILTEKAQAEALFLRQQTLRAQAIADEEKRRIALINLRYDHEAGKFADNRRLFEASEKARALEIEAVRKDMADRRQRDELQRQDELAEAARRAAIDKAAEQFKIAQANQDQARTVEELELKVKHRGEPLALAKALLKLERERTIEAAKRAGLDVGLVERQFDLRRRLLDAGPAVAQARNRIAAVGTFTGRASQLLDGGGSVIPRKLDILAEEMRNVKRAVQDVGDGLGAV